MQFNNRRFGDATKPFLKNPFITTFEFGSAPVPPGDCFLGIQATSGILALQVGGFLSVHCPSTVYELVDYQGNRYVDYQGNRYVEVQE